MEAEPLDVPRDRWLAEQVVRRRAAVRATDDRGLDVDLSLVMAGLDFETVWRERLLATHAEALRDLLRREEPSR